MTPALTRSPRPFCAYCSTGLRDLCPTMRAIKAGLPGMQERLNLRPAIVQPKPAPLERGRLFRAFREAGCDFTETSRVLGISARRLSMSLTPDLRESLARIRKASRENL